MAQKVVLALQEYRVQKAILVWLVLMGVLVSLAALVSLVLQAKKGSQVVPV